MTWSVVARDSQTGEIGIAVATRFFAVGSLCPHVRPGAGAVATQALINPLHGIDGIELMRRGVPAAETLAALLARDEGREVRQVHLMDAAGRIAAHTGKNCVDWAGHLVFGDFSVAGNMLAGAKVIEETARVFAATKGKPLAERFLDSLDAGEAAGGDKRGRQSAAIRIHSRDEYPDLDIRVDDHEAPLPELRRLLAKSRERYAIFRTFLATRENPAGEWDRTKIDAALAAAGAK
ncbi:MAG: DUF1028 domain-containing protein [Rhodospirillales bacterium]|nr:DUF1028 domain-containing protein [Rhodospirillales bacterium]